MEPEFWQNVWREGRIGFHEGRPNSFLARHGERFSPERRVLVPLCGKTEDLAYLASLGHDVVGVELSEFAARAFFAEHELVPSETRDGSLLLLEAPTLDRPNLRLVVGDFFEVTRAALGEVDALYDRAALIALPEPLRRRYVGHLRALLPNDFEGLLVTCEYPPGALKGPPFSVSEEEVFRLWSGHGAEHLETEPAEALRFKTEGVDATESAFWLAPTLATTTKART